MPRADALVSDRSPNPATGTASIPISVPDLGEEVEKSVLDTLRSGRLSQGPVTEEFEELCAAMAGTRYAVAMSNGSVTLEAALDVLGIGVGDEVITTPFTFVATINAILARGSVVRFADITPDLTIDPQSVESLVGPDTAAILPVHLFGLPADMPRLMATADRHQLAVVEDAAQAHGAACDGRPVGSFGLGSFSFYATKNVTAAEGGVVTTRDLHLAHQLRLVRNHGMSVPYVYERRGSNLRLSELHAAVAIPQLKRLDEINASRSRNASILNGAFADLDMQLPHIPDGRTHVWHQYTLLLPDHLDRDRFVRELNGSGIGARVYYPDLVWNYGPFKEDARIVQDDAPVASDASRRCVSLPVHQKLDGEQLDAIVRVTRDSFQKLS